MLYERRCAATKQHNNKMGVAATRMLRWMYVMIRKDTLGMVTLLQW